MAIKGDFISFTYNGVHSTELGVLRVTSSNRYTDALLPTIQDKTVQVPGSDGTYFFGSYYTQRLITLNIAFDEVTEAQLRLIRKTLGSDRLSHELIFDDEPYKVYYAKVTGTPQLQYIPFSTPRIYKGEGTFTFTCYEPFAHTLNNQKYLSQFPGYTEDKELSGSLVSFNDGIGNLKKLEVKFNLSQDFNGYSRPWPAGGGENKWEPLEGTHNGVTFTLQDDGSVKISGETISANNPYKFQAVDLPWNGISAGDDVVLWSDKYNGVICYEGDTNILSKFSKDGVAETFTIPANATSIRMSQYAKSTTPTAGEAFDTTGHYYFAKADAFIAWSPYENICPITGRTGANVYVSPTQDQQDATTYTSDWTSPAGTVYAGTVDLATGVLTVDMVMVDLGTITFTYDSNYDSFRNRRAITDARKSGPGSDRHVPNLLTSIGFIPSERMNAAEKDLSISLNSSSHSSNTLYIKYQKYSGDVDAFTAAMSGVQLCYELAEPLTYQLTAQEVSVLEGQNNIWSNSGDVKVIYSKPTGAAEDWKLEWNPSANLLDEQGSYDTYDNITGFKLYNPGDIETDFKLIIPTSSNFTINGIIISNSLTSESKILTTSITSLKGEDVLIQFNSKTNLIEGLDAQGARTGNLYNDCIVSGEWFKLPLTTDGNWHFQIIDYSNISEIAPKIVYDYLYF